MAKRRIAATVIDIGSRRELFVDDFLIEKMRGARLQLHHPQRQNVAMRFNKPWEGCTTGYCSIFQDGESFRMYYRGSGADKVPSVVCMAESSDGIRWRRPSIKLHRFQGSKQNNIVYVGNDNDVARNFSVFRDANPAAPDSERYKMIGGYPLKALVSPDGIHWRLKRKQPVIADARLDSQNVAFYDPARGQYMAYYRDLRKRIASEEIIEDPTGDLERWDGNRSGAYRSILQAVSDDFVHWNYQEHRFLDFGDTPPEDLYTNAIQPYFRAPHIYVGMPKRYVPGRRYHKDWKNDGVSDGVFMSSRDGLHFDRRFLEAFIQPGLDPACWIDRNNTPAWGVLQTLSAAPNRQPEMSVFWNEHCHLPGCRLRRGTLRLDGFVSVQAGYGGGQLVTKPFVFSGSQLELNCATSAAGSLRVELRDQTNKPIRGYELKNAPEYYGNELAHIVTWKGGSDVSSLAGRPVRLRILLKDADLYSLCFV
jgi:hypothetical protein